MQDTITKKPHCITMVGLICSGKTTIWESVPVLNAMERACSDSFVFDAVQEGEFESYTQACHPKNHVSFKQAFWNLLGMVKEDHDDVVVDRLNIESSARAKLLEFFPDHQHIAVNVHATVGICKRRCAVDEEANRANGNHHLVRDIPGHVFHHLRKRLEPVRLKEGYRAIIHVDQNGRFMSLQGTECDMTRAIIDGLKVDS